MLFNGFQPFQRIPLHVVNAMFIQFLDIFFLVFILTFQVQNRREITFFIFRVTYEVVYLELQSEVSPAQSS